MLLNELKQNPYLKYNTTLSNILWDSNKNIKKEPYNALYKIADAFIEEVKLPKQAIKDIIITGSLCNYNYTKYSDIDLHIVIDYKDICADCGEFDILDCYQAKKKLWNDTYDITYENVTVELYIEDESEPVTDDAGIFSLKQKKWLQHPKKIDKHYVNKIYSDKSIDKKAKALMDEIDLLIDKGESLGRINKLKQKIRNMRKSALEKDGELALENLVFKILRNSGHMKKLFDYEIEKKEQDLSV